MLDNEYVTNRVSTANNVQLVELLYEGMMDYIKEGKIALESKDEKTYNLHMAKVRDILAELLATLQGDSEISNSLRRIYLFINDLITTAATQKDPQKLEGALKVITPLYDAWREISNNEEASEKQGPALVTGYTYGKDKLNDYVANENTWEKA
ncbi:flagellar export chaperone FliS [Alkaliphilus pronyensis]|uniref:Flagellar export chaperone FliS n=1 Tax=Alkaliphilus pronyensis TaxID=1482732 RepID=A0A6I0F720_9FIRM|nr:flagellar export chaperone FliS [Alkaliphilus pronyensis]KAB3529578.1 flagellar export chaperone FliS [Alkaliphilus pronyensis]